MSDVIRDTKQSLEYAIKYSPKIYQEVGFGLAPWDLIIPLASKEPYMEAIQKPTLNYSIREDLEYVYAYYMIYHKFDYSTSPIEFINKLDSHPNDTEAILFRVSKDSGTIDIITISHFKFIFGGNVDKKIVIEAGSHAIRPYRDHGPKRNYVVYRIFDYVNLSNIAKDEWEILRAKVKPALMPDKQYDALMRGSSSGKLHNRKGDLYLRPEKVFKSAELKGWI